MTHQQYRYYQILTEHGSMPDELNPVFLFSMASKSLLLDIVNGKLDALQLARLELFNRGIDEKSGRWIGWNAKKIEDVFELH